MQKFLVIAATGTVGRPLTHKLLAIGHCVHVLTTHPDSERAHELARAGAKIFRGALDDKAAIAAAAATCTGVYLNPTPASLADHHLEVTYAQNIIEASRAAGIRFCVYQSVQNTHSIATMPEWQEWISSAGIVADYWNRKMSIQEAVRTAGFDCWAAIQGSMHFSNFGARYLAMLFPGVRDHPVGTLSFPIQVDTVLDLVDPVDLAEIATRVLLDPQAFNGLAFNAVGEKMTLAQIAAVIAKHANKPMRAEYPDPDIVKAQRATDLQAGNGEVLAIFANRTDISVCQALGIEFNTLDKFLEKKQDELREVVA